MACIDLHHNGYVGEGSDHLQLIKFWPSCAPGRGSAAGRNFFLAPPYYRHRAVFASLRALFSLLLLCPRPHRAEVLYTDGRCLSVRLCVP